MFLFAVALRTSRLVPSLTTPRSVYDAHQWQGDHTPGSVKFPDISLTPCSTPAWVAVTHIEHVCYQCARSVDADSAESWQWSNKQQSPYNGRRKACQQSMKHCFSARCEISDKQFSVTRVFWTLPCLLVNSLTFPGFCDKRSPCSKFLQVCCSCQRKVALFFVWEMLDASLINIVGHWCIFLFFL